MRRLLSITVFLFILSGCAFGQSEMDRAMQIRQRLLGSGGCTFDTVITADYAQQIYTFSMQCSVDSAGQLSFTVTAPDSISGITGTIDSDGGRLTFDEAVLTFPLLAEGQVSPVSAPWLFVRTLKGGYLSGCTEDGDGLLLQIDDSYEEDAIRLDVRTDGQDLPVRCEMVWQGRRILSLDVRNFTYL